MKINPNDPAVPTMKVDLSRGLTKLEYAAVQIMAGMASNPYRTHSPNDMAEFSVSLARALFAELEKQG